MQTYPGDWTILQQNVTKPQLSQARGQDEKEQPRRRVARLRWDSSGRWVDLRRKTKKNNKKLPTGAENITRGEGRLTLGKTAPAVPFLTSPGSPGLAARARLPLAPPSPHQTHARRARHTRHGRQALPRAGVHKRGHGLTGTRERVDFAYSASV